MAARAKAVRELWIEGGREEGDRKKLWIEGEEKETEERRCADK